MTVVVFLAAGIGWFVPHFAVREPAAARLKHPVQLSEAVDRTWSTNPVQDGELASLGVRAVAIEEQRSYEGQAFPLVLTPLRPPFVKPSLKDWAIENRDELLQLVRENEAVLMRGFPETASALDFSEFVSSLELEPFGMGCSAAPRTNVAPGVFTANEAPPSELIPVSRARWSSVVQ